MGTTNKYGLRWPEAAAFARDGWAAIRMLAQDVEAALLPPLLATDGDGTLSWSDKVAEVPWDVTDDPARRRGAWDSTTNAERLVIPALSGWYFVSASVVFTGKAEPDVFELRITTREVGSGAGTVGATWARVKVDVPNSSADDSVLSAAALVRIPDSTPRTGFAVRVAYKGSVQPPATAAGQNKLRAIRVSAL